MTPGEYCIQFQGVCLKGVRRMVIIIRHQRQHKWETQGIVLTRTIIEIKAQIGMLYKNEMVEVCIKDGQDDY